MSQFVPTRRCETRSISIDAPPDAVLDFVGDPTNLPSWAPGFARAIRPEGAHWTIETIAGEAQIDVRVSPGARTVDILAAKQPPVGERGSFSRVVANGGGSEFIFTLFFPVTFSEEAVARQLANVDEELVAVKRLVES